MNKDFIWETSFPYEISVYYCKRERRAKMKITPPTVLTLRELQKVAAQVTGAELNGLPFKSKYLTEDRIKVLLDAKITKTAFTDGVLFFVNEEDIQFDVDEEAVEALQGELAQAEKSFSKLMQEALEAGLNPIQSVNRLTPISTMAVELRDKIEKLQDPDVDDVVRKAVAELYPKTLLEIGVDAVCVRQNVRQIEEKFGVKELILMPLVVPESGDSLPADFLPEYFDDIAVATWDEKTKTLTIVAIMRKAASLSIQCKRLGAGIVGYADQANNGVNGTTLFDVTQVTNLVVADELILEDGLEVDDE
jgi:hypothetical protein